jgi:uncharacterized protein
LEAGRWIITVDREMIVDFLKRNKSDMEKRFTVKRIGLFGSFLHGAADEQSDIDILVVLAQPTLDHYMDLKFFLEDELGKSVDLVLADSLKPRLRPIITAEAAYV